MFFLMLPFIIGDMVPIDNEYWKLYLVLAKIVDIVELDEFTLGLIIELKWLIEEHHNMYKLLFKNETLKKNTII